MLKLKFIPHPDDEAIVTLNPQLEHIKELLLHIDIDSEGNYYIAQVNDRLTIKNSYMCLTGEYTNTDWK